MWINNDAGLQIGHADMGWRREVRVWLLSLMWRYSNMKIVRDIFCVNYYQHFIGALIEHQFFISIN